MAEAAAALRSAASEDQRATGAAASAVAAPAEDDGDAYVKARLFEALGPEGRVLLAKRMQQYQSDCVAFAEDACAERERVASQQVHESREQLHEQLARYASLFTQRQGELESRLKERGRTLEASYAARHEEMRERIEEERATMARESRSLRSELAAERIQCAGEVSAANEEVVTMRAHVAGLEARLEGATRAAAERLEMQRAAEGRATVERRRSENELAASALLQKQLTSVAAECEQLRRLAAQRGAREDQWRSRAHAALGDHAAAMASTREHAARERQLREELDAARASVERRQRQIDALRAAGAAGGGYAPLRPAPLPLTLRGSAGAGSDGVAQLASALLSALQGASVAGAVAMPAAAAPVVVAVPRVEESAAAPDADADAGAEAEAEAEAEAAPTTRAAPPSPVVRRHRPESPVAERLDGVVLAPQLRAAPGGASSVSSCSAPTSIASHGSADASLGDDESAAMSDALATSTSSRGGGGGGETSADLSTDLEGGADDDGRFGFGMDSDASGMSSFGAV